MHAHCSDRVLLETRSDLVAAGLSGHTTPIDTQLASTDDIAVGIDMCATLLL